MIQLSIDIDTEPDSLLCGGCARDYTDWPEDGDVFCGIRYCGVFQQRIELSRNGSLLRCADCLALEKQQKENKHDSERTERDTDRG